MIATSQQLRSLKVVFDEALPPNKLPAFRGAVTERVGREHALFHNHDGKGFHYRYPLVQYTLEHGRPTLFCLGEGVDEVHHFFQRADWSVQVHGRKLDMRIHNLHLQDNSLRMSDQLQSYRLRNWLALNQENYRRYQGIRDDAARLEFLRGKLVGNILSFAKGVGWRLPERLEIPELSLQAPRTIRFKGQPLLAFNGRFAANIMLPEGIGLGKGVSVGWGRIDRIK